jgi:hypothetical protein
LQYAEYAILYAERAMRCAGKTRKVVAVTG